MNWLPPLGLYVHIPFCERKCPYCDFNTYAGLESLFDDTVDALCAEMARWRAALATRPVATVFIGGGTPTVLKPHQLERLFTSLHRNFRLAAGCEITCEANPGTVDRAKFGVLRALGVTRLSMGVQSFQPHELRFLGRIHTVEDVQLAFAAAREAGFDNINLDFIFGLPHHSVEQWTYTLDQALALAPEHLSLYSLIVEPNTPLYHWVQSGQVEAPDDDVAADLYEEAMARLPAAGYVQYEVSNWARKDGPAAPDHDAASEPAYACRHNLIYWRNEDWLGIGPGAHSHLRLPGDDGFGLERRWGNRKSVPGYVKRMRDGESVEGFNETIGARLAMGETMMLGLRLLQEGVPFDRFERLHHASLVQVFAEELAELEAAGLIQIDTSHVCLTHAGLLFGNRVFSRFLPD